MCGGIFIIKRYGHHPLTFEGTNPFTSVYIEHLIYSAALAVIVGMFFSRFKGTDPSWIIIAVAFVPDIDFVLQELRKIPGITLPFVVRHGDFHNIMALIFFSLVIAAAAYAIGMWFPDAFVCAIIGIAAHLFEDALIADPAYRFFWPFSLENSGDWYHDRDTGYPWGCKQ